MPAPWLRLFLMTAALWLGLPAWGFVGEGQKLGDWEVVRVDRHPEYFRVSLTGPGGETGIEVVADDGAAGDWSTGRHRLMPAPDQTPPAAVLLQAMEALRAYDEIKGPLLTYKPGSSWPGKVQNDSPDVLFLREPGIPDGGELDEEFG